MSSQSTQSTNEPAWMAELLKAEEALQLVVVEEEELTEEELLQREKESHEGTKAYLGVLDEDPSSTTLLPHSSEKPTSKVKLRTINGSEAARAKRANRRKVSALEAASWLLKTHEDALKKSSEGLLTPESVTRIMEFKLRKSKEDSEAYKKTAKAILRIEAAVRGRLAAKQAPKASKVTRVKTPQDDEHHGEAPHDNEALHEA